MTNEIEKIEEKSLQDIDSTTLKIEEGFSQSSIESEKEIQQRKLDEAEQSVSKQKSKKSKIINIIFFIANIAIVAGILIYQLTKEAFQLCTL